MRFSKPFFIFAVLAGAAVLGAFQDEEKKVEDTPEVKQVKAQYEKMLKAYNEKSLETIMNLTTDGFTWKMIDGETLKRKEAEASLKDLLARVDNGKWTLKIDNTVVIGAIAQSVIELKFEGSLKDSKTGRTYSAEISSKERHTWSLGNEMWKVRRVETLDQDTKTNGIKSKPNVDNGGTTQNPPPPSR